MRLMYLLLFWQDFMCSERGTWDHFRLLFIEYSFAEWTKCILTNCLPTLSYVQLLSDSGDSDEFSARSTN